MTVTTEVPAREANRRELATMLDRDPAELTDDARLVADLSLDSLAMMRLLTWLSARGVSVDTDSCLLANVGEVLSLLDKVAFPGLSIRVTEGRGISLPGVADVSVRPQRHGDPQARVLEGQAFRLVPPRPDDIGYLYGLAVDPDIGFRWRYRGSVPSFERFSSEFWTSVVVQLVARRIQDDLPVGHVVAYGGDMSMGYTYLGAVFQPEYTGTGLAAQAVAVFVRYLFKTFPLRKIYIEVPGFNWAQMASGEGILFEIEGVLKKHEYYDGQYWDKYYCAIYPESVSSP
ncbi:MAG TPA: GNAT family N-acetyltransferase [Candidatus Limnocylindrales bacterium]|nr:GNAT family N-acetyltransferase [Candidatus Limnocylindrales bacterium]